MSTPYALAKRSLEVIGEEAALQPFKVFTARDLDQIEPIRNLSEQVRFEMRVVSAALPFRVNSYVLDQLIDWSPVPEEDPIFQLTFPQRQMLTQISRDPRGNRDPGRKSICIAIHPGQKSRLGSAAILCAIR